MGAEERDEVSRQVMSGRVAPDGAPVQAELARDGAVAHPLRAQAPDRRMARDALATLSLGPAR